MLLDVIIESLERFEGWLQGDIPGRATLWNEIPRSGWRPKDEESLSDAVARHLREDLVSAGIVVNREVQVQRRDVDRDAGGAAGQRLDIVIDAVPLSAQAMGEVWRVVVEVKGCWHPYVKTAMSDQLVGLYLHQHASRHGLYLVGWFSSPGWDSADHRRNRVPWDSIDATRSYLEAQAADLTPSEHTDEIRSLVLDCSLP